MRATRFSVRRGLLCGMALGFEDTGAVENSLRTERAPVEEWATFY